MLSLIDKIIAKQFLGYFLAGLSVFVMIFLAADFTSSLVRFNAGIEIFAKYYAYYLPQMVYQMIPVACLIGAMFTLSNMNKNNELVSLFSMGVSLARISAPILVLVAILSVMAFFLGDRVLPGALRSKNYVYYVELKKKPNLYSTVKQNKIWYRSDNVIFNIGVLDPKADTAQALTMYYFNEAWDLVQIIKAREVKLLDDVWSLDEGTVTLFSTESSFPMTRSFKNKMISMSEELSDIKSAPPTSDVLSVAELRRYIRKNKALSLDTKSFEVDLHGKIAFAFSGLILALLGIPFTTKSQRQGGLMLNVGIAAGMALVYWILFSAGMSVGKAGLVPPILAAWGPNVLLMGFAIHQLRKVP